MTRRLARAAVLLLFLAATCLPAVARRQVGGHVLWQIGAAGSGTAQFALGPSGFRRFQDDGVFVVGRSDARTAWPYVHPGPADGWAGSRPHTFSVFFTLADRVPSGPCELALDLADTHAGAPPVLRVAINGHDFERTLPAGGGDRSINGDWTRGRPRHVTIEFASAILRTGTNRLDITTLSGSWFLYDAVALRAPQGALLGAPPDGTLIDGTEPREVWLNDAAGPRQPVDLRIIQLGSSVDASVALGDMPPKAVTLRPGAQTVRLLIPAAPQATKPRARIRAGSLLVAEADVTIVPPRLQDFWLLHHSHVDIGYTHLQQEVERHHVSHLETVLKLADASAGEAPAERFKWNTEAMWAVDLWLKQASPERRTALLDAVRRGQIGVNALQANVLTGLPRPEELLRVLQPAVRFSKETGIAADSAIICDVPGYTWGLVSAMAQAGVKYFAIAPNEGDRVGTIHAFDDKPFWWVGPSGRDQVLAFVVNNYHANGDLEAALLNRVRRLAEERYGYDMALVFWSGRWPNGGVDNPPPDEDLVAKVKAWNTKYARPKARIATTSEFFRELDKRVGNRLPRMQGDMTPYWEDGAGSTARETAMNRASSDRLAVAEILWAMRAPAARPAARFADAWTRAVMYSEHTWGAHNSISEPDLPFVTEQWAYKQAFALDADRLSRELFASAIEQHAPGAIDLGAFDVVNTTQWPRTELVVLPDEYGRFGSTIVDDRSVLAPSQKLASGEVAFLARDVPPFAARRYRVRGATPPPSGHATTSGNQMITSRLRVRLDPSSGAVRSLRLANDTVDFVDAAAPVGLDDFRYVIGEDAAHAQSNGQVRITVVDPGPLVATLRIESAAPGCNRLVREVRVVDGLDDVEFTNVVDRQPVRTKDGVHFGFGFNVPGGTVRMETPWAIVRPEVDQLAVGCRNWFTVQRWVDVSNRDRGVALASLDAPLVEIGGLTANLLGSVARDRWMTRTLDSQTLYSWAQNNHWHTNYKADQPGVTTFRYVIRPRHGAWSPADAARFGLETTRRLVVMPATGAADSTPFLQVSSPDVTIETVKASEDGQRLIVRLFNVATTERAVTLGGTAGRGPAWLTDLSEKPLGAIRGKIHVPARGIVSVMLDLK